MRIRVVGYMDTEKLDDDQVDLFHATGVTEEAFIAWATGERLFQLYNVEMELERDG